MRNASSKNVWAVVFISLFAAHLSFAVTYTAPTKDEVKTAQKKFKFRGQWIHPKIIREFMPWDSDYELPLIAAIDVGAATNTNRYFGDIKILADEQVSFADENGTIILYKWLGRFKNGMHALLIKEASSGTLVSNSLGIFALTKRSSMNEKNQEYPQLILEIKRYVGLGDRAETKFSIHENSMNVEVICNKTCESKKFKISVQ